MAKKNKLDTTESQPTLKGHDDWKVEDACNCLLRAQEIRQDSDLMKQVMKKLSTKKKAIDSVAELREIANEMNEKD